MASSSSEKKQPLQDAVPDSPVSAADSRRGSVDTLETPGAGPSAAISTPAPPDYSPSSSAQGPTVDAPFNFPAAAPPPPEYSAARADGKLRPVAIPQVAATATATFLPAYAPALLPLGIPASSWLAFLSTLSAFLTASVSQQAMTHAADVAHDMASVPTRLGRDLAAHAALTGRGIGSSARRGNVGGVVSNVVGLTVGSVARVVGSVVSLPGHTAGALIRKPRSPRERAEIYVLTANKEWLHQRGLRAQILGTGELAEMYGVASSRILDAAGEGEMGPRQRLARLGDYVGELKVEDKAEASVENLEIGRSTLWLVLVPEEKEGKASQW